jgi:hypothetical protein
MDVTILLPPTPLFAWRRCDGSDASVVHKAFARGVWVDRSIAERALLVLRILVGWPFVTVAMIAACTGVNGAVTRKRFGRPIWRQVSDQIGLAIRHSVPPPWYYIFGLWDDAKRKQAHLYIFRYETKRAIYRFLRAHLRGSARALVDKLEFDRRCRKHGLPVATLVAIVRDGAIEGNRPLPEADLFVKPVSGRGGSGAERWEWIASNRYRNHRGEEYTETELVALLSERSLENPLLVQQRVRNHPDLLEMTTGALATARVMTVRNERDEFEVGFAVFRTGFAPDSPVDNYHAGGLVMAIDLDTGELGQASGGGSTGMPRVANLVRCDVHPVTGARIRGRKLPCWNEVKQLAIRAHGSFAGMAVVGWDIAITAEGPILIEGNSGPDVDLMQVGHQAPIGNTRVAAALAHHLKNALPDLRA